MSDSLKDQLLKAGFKETKAASKAKNTGKKPARKGRSGQKKTSSSGSAAISGSANSGAKKSGTKSSTNSSKVSEAAKSQASEQQDAAAIAEKKRVKAAIKELIEGSALKDFKGETAYSFVLGKKVRQLFVNADAHKKLSDGEWVITRLNGNTQLIPLEKVEAILQLNPDWAIVQNQADGDQSAEDDDYKDFQIPDDLTW